MSKNTLIKNNLIAIVIHICLCLLILPSAAFMVVDPTLALLVPIPHTLIVCGLYFLAGLLFLHSTKNMATDFISVVGLAIAIIIATFLAYADLWIWGNFLLLSFIALGIALVNHFPLAPIEVELINVTLLLLLPLLMWVGLRTKSYISTLKIQQPTLRNRLLLVLSKKEQSFVLFIVLACSLYLLPILMIAIMFVFEVLKWVRQTLLGV